MVLKKVMGVEVNVPDTPQRQTILSIAEADESEHQKLERRIGRLEKRMSRIGFGQWAIGVLVTLVGFVLTWVTTSQPDRNAAAAREVASATAESVVRQRMKQTEDIAAEAADRGSDRALRRFRAESEVPPLQRGPDLVAARGTKR